VSAVGIHLKPDGAWVAAAAALLEQASILQAGTGGPPPSPKEAMPVVLVSYAFKNEYSWARNRVIRALRAERHWMWVSDAAMLVDTPKSPQEMYAGLSKLIGPDDKVLVFVVTGSYFGQHAKDVVDWLAARFRAG
jgi:hypothetical protein